ncbi:MAG: hypothetical protein JSV44_06350, partial [Candidatus Zixiibacteriota bacterium]
MFLIKAEAATGRMHSAGVAELGECRFLEKNGIRFTIILGPLYAFSFEIGSQILVGESMVPISSDDMNNVLTGAANLDDYRRKMGNYIQLLVIFDPAARTATIINSIASSRPYYYCLRGGTSWFSTSLKALKISGVPLEIDEARLPEFYTYRLIVPPRTL